VGFDRQQILALLFTSQRDSTPIQHDFASILTIDWGTIVLSRSKITLTREQQGQNHEVKEKREHNRNCDVKGHENKCPQKLENFFHNKMNYH